MGQTGSRVVNKITSSFSFSGGPPLSTDDPEEFEEKRKAMVRFGAKLPLVYSRRGSMYFDEDGDLAHEFYEEVLPKKRGGLRRMRKINSKHLVPQGEVQYPNPRLHTDFPIILFEDAAVANSIQENG